MLLTHLSLGRVTRPIIDEVRRARTRNRESMETTVLVRRIGRNLKEMISGRGVESMLFESEES